MTKLPRGLPARKVLKALKKARFYIRRQKGSHVIMRRDNPFAQVVVPIHKQIDTGTLDVIIEATGLSIEEFIELL